MAFLYCTLHNVAPRNLPLPAAVGPLADAAVRYHGVILTVWVAVLVLLFGESFWYYWRALL